MTNVKTSSSKAWAVTLIASLFFFFVYIQVNLFNAISPYLLKDFQLTAAQLGQFSSYYFIINIALLFPAGILLDRFSPYKIILLSMIIGVLGTIVFSFANSYSMLVASRIMIGLCGTSCFLACIKIASRWFPMQRMALVTGSIVTMAMLGGIVAQVPFTLLTDHIGWRHALLVDAALGLLITILIAVFVRDYPHGNKKIVEKQENRVEHMTFFKLLKKVVLNRQNICGGLFISLINLPVFVIGAMWGSMYLVQAHHLTRSQATIVTSMLFSGLIIGSPLAGWVSDLWKKRRLPMILGAIASLIVALTIMYLPNSSFIIFLILFFLLGLAISSQIIGYPLIAESNSLALTGTATGLASIFILTAGMTQGLFGWLLGLHWKHVVLGGEPVYAASDYRLAMLILPVGFAIGLISALLCKETHCIGKKE
jgi:sugar phosphate permease